MKATDIQIGDWVYSTFCDCPTRIYGIEEYEATGYCNVKVSNVIGAKDIASLSPIPLTEEILEKNHFSKSLLMGEQRHFTYRLGPSLNMLAIYDADFSIKIGESARQIKYVHQLQHALRLCGIEKDINL